MKKHISDYRQKKPRGRQRGSREDSILKEMKIVYTTDLHGEIWEYDRLLKAARDFQSDVVINGGDMLPKLCNHRPRDYGI